MVIPYAYTRMVCTIRVRYKYAYGTEHVRNHFVHYCILHTSDGAPPGFGRTMMLPPRK